MSDKAKEVKKFTAKTGADRKKPGKSSAVSNKKGTGISKSVAGSGKSAVKKPESGKTVTKKPESGKAVIKKPESGKSAAKKPESGKSATNKASLEQNGEASFKKTNTVRAKTKNPDIRLVKSHEADNKSTKEKSVISRETFNDYKEDSRKQRTEKRDYKADYGKIYKGREWFAQNKSLVKIGLTIAILAAILAGAYYYIMKTYTVTTVYVDGNLHYSNEEVMELVMTGAYGNNSLFLAAKYKDKGVEGIPFVEKMDVNILTPDTIRINVYEKALAGYVEYLGRYMYFDKDGIVVESSDIKTSGIPQVTGLKFDYVVLNEPLPVENEEIFAGILSITQLLAKYELTADKIFFDSSYDLTLYFGGVRVTLGSGSEIDQKIMRLQYIFPELEGKEGTLQMENYTEDTKYITFNED